MGFKFKYNKLLLFFTGISLMLSLGYFVYLKIYQPTSINNDYHALLSKNVNEQIDISQAELQVLKNQLVKKNNYQQSFFKFAKTNTKPVFVYKNQRIVYWSDNRLVPEYKDINEINENGVKKIDNNFVIIVRKTYLVEGDTLDLVSLIDLYQSSVSNNENRISNYNPEIFTPSPARISRYNFVNSEKINDSSGKPLFYYISTDPKNGKTNALPSGLLWFFCVSIVLVTIVVFNIVLDYFRRHKYGVGFSILLSYLVVLRIFAIYTNIPLFILKQNFETQVNFHSTYYTPTFVDSIVHNFFLLIFLTFFSLFYNRSRYFYKIIQNKVWIKNIYSVIAVLLEFWVIQFCVNKFQTLYEKSDFSLGLSLSLDFSFSRLLIILYYLIILGVFYFASHILVYTFSKLQKNRKYGFLCWLYGVILGMIITNLVSTLNFSYLIASVYFLVIYLFNFPRYFYTLRFKTIIYYFFSGFCFALITSILVFNLESKKNLLEQKKFAIKYSKENDPIAEALLEKLSQELKFNPEIIQAFKRKYLVSESIANLVKDRYLDIYFYKYNIEVLAFDPEGKNYQTQQNSLSDYNSVFNNNIYKTRVQNLYFKTVSADSTLQNKYLLINDIYAGINKVGTILIKLNINKEASENDLNGLINNKLAINGPIYQNFSFGVFSPNKKLNLSSGSFNYQLSFPKKAFYKQNLYGNGVIIKGYTHFGLIGKNKNTIVVSRPIIGIQNAVSNFAYLILLSIAGNSILFFLFTLLYGIKNFSINLSSKIQLYLNAAFFFPLIIIILLTITVVKNTLVSVQDRTFKDNTKNIANTFLLHLNNYNEGKSSKDFFEKEISQLALDTKRDINFFGTDGRLALSTKPLIFQHNIVSSYINPTIYRDIIENKDDEELITENLDNLEYKTVYYGLKNKNNQILGVIGIPFFNSKPTLDQQIKQVVSTILVIFLVMFILLLLLSYMASNELTSPLKIITQKLKRTNLDKLDEPIEWKSNDEIGLLTRTYNRMLLKLNESKIALSQNEKQTAWQEMAKQVAHEIKNPLTPMKLSIQQLQRTLPHDPETKVRIERALNSLNEQIDNISEIANSFSEFAKMPVPRSEIFDLVGLTRKTTDLYSENNAIRIKFKSDEKVIFVKSDRLLMSRVITNLILNGIQSVPPIRKPEISVTLSKNEENKFAILTVSDNGSGIPEDVRKKVFIPNFSTKVGGSGLGLAMAKRGIEHVGGNIWFETIEGEGTQFFVDVPLA